MTRREGLERLEREIVQERATARLMLRIQREAIGLRHHRDVDRQFPEPPRRS
jgi:hypothetical protein